MQPAGIPNVALRRPDRRPHPIHTRTTGNDLAGLGNRQICTPGGIPVPRIRPVEIPVPVAGGFRLQVVAPGLSCVGADAPADVVQGVVAFQVVGMDHTVGRRNQHRPGPKVGMLAVPGIVFPPLVIKGRAAVDAHPGSRLDMDDVVGRDGIELQVILHRGVLKIRIGPDHIEKVAVLPVVGVGVEHAEVVAVAVAKHQHGPLGVVVDPDMLRPNVLRLEGPVAAPRIFIPFVSARRNRNDALHAGVGWIAPGIHILHETGLIPPGSRHPRRRPDVVELDPLAAERCRIRIQLVGLVRSDAGGRRPRVALASAVEMPVVHDDPLDSLVHQGGDHIHVEGALRGPESLGIAAAGVPDILVSLLVQAHLHAHRLLGGERHERVVVGDADQIQTRVIARGAQTVASPSVMVAPTCAIEPIHVFHEGSRKTHLHAGVGDVSALLDGVLRPLPVGAGPRVVHPAHAEVEATVAVGLVHRLVRKINRLMHVPQIRDMNGVLPKGRISHQAEQT